MTNMTRTFLAIELDPKAQEDLHQIQQTLFSAYSNIKWVKTNQLHLTLKFFAHLFPEQVIKIKNTMPAICQQFNPILFKFNILGLFPDTKNPRIIWIGTHLAKTNSYLIKLAEHIDMSFKNFGATHEKKVFRPHVTLGRIKTLENNSALISNIKTYQFNRIIEQTIKHITLFKSTLTAKGPVYESLTRFNLGSLPPLI